MNTLLFGIHRYIYYLIDIIRYYFNKILMWNKIIYNMLNKKSKIDVDGNFLMKGRFF